MSEKIFVFLQCYEKVNIFGAIYTVLTHYNLDKYFALINSNIILPYNRQENIVWCWMQTRCDEIPHHKKGKLMQRLCSYSTCLLIFQYCMCGYVEGIFAGKCRGTGCGHFSAVTQSECRINVFRPVHIAVICTMWISPSKDSDFTASSKHYWTNANSGNNTYWRATWQKHLSENMFFQISFIWSVAVAMSEIYCLFCYLFVKHFCSFIYKEIYNY